MSLVKFDGEIGSGVPVGSVRVCSEHPFSGGVGAQLKLGIRGVYLAAFVFAKCENNRVSDVLCVVWRCLVYVAAVNRDGAPLEMTYGAPLELIKMPVVTPFCCCQ